jgi:iron complex outermembrane receptor protein
MTMSAVFAQMAFNLGDRATLYAGARHDFYESFGGTTNPRIALVMHPRKGMTLKALYGSAFRAPNLYELHYQDGGITQKPAADLRPETLGSGELSIEQELGAGVRVSAAFYTIRTSDLINLVTDSTDGLLVFDNEGSPYGQGVEVNILAKLRGLRARLTYAQQRAFDDDRETPLNSPKHIAHGSASLPLLRNRFTLGLEVHHVGSRPTLDGSVVPSYTVAATNMQARPFSNGTEFFASVRNLFDVQYSDPGGPEHVQNALPRDGRSIRAGLLLRW